MAEQGQSSSGPTGSLSPHSMLWRHKDPESTCMYDFKRLVEKKYNVRLDGYEALRQWSITHLAQFWEEVWHFTGIQSSTPFTKVSVTHVIIGDSTQRLD